MKGAHMKNFFRRLNRYVPSASIIIYVLTLICLALYFSFMLSTEFSDFFNRYISGAFRFALAKLTGWFPFSLAETLIFLSPVLVIFLSVWLIRLSGKGRRETWRCVTGLISALCLVFCMFTLNFAPGYRGSSLGEKLNLSDRAVTADELYDTISIVIDNVNSEAENVKYTFSGASVIPFDYFRLSDELNSAYRAFHEKYDIMNTFDSRVKPLVISPLMTYTHISGIYTYFTGEANLNTNYPDYVNVYTAAHEMAHQRGAARENEANFAAFLVCIGSDNEYVRYSGYLSMYSYLASALYSASPELYSKAYEQLCREARYELRAYSSFFDKYRDSTASQVSDAFNDAYLQSQGTQGSVSYGLVVDLAVSYYLDS